METAQYRQQIHRSQSSRVHTPAHSRVASSASFHRRTPRDTMPVLLLQPGNLAGVADPDQRDAVGRTSLHVAAARGNVEQVRSLIARGARVDLACQRGRTPLMVAAGNGHAEVVALLARAKCGINLRDCRGSSAIALAARRGHQRVIVELLRHGADIDGADARQRTPLMLAAAHDHYPAVLSLCRAGAEIDYADERGWTAATYAAQHGVDGVLGRLLKVAAEKDLGLAAGRRGRLVRTLRYEVRSHVFGEPRLQALSHDLGVALDHGQVRTARLLVDCGARLDSHAAHATLKTAVLRSQPSLTTVALDTLQNSTQGRAIIERQFRKALKTSASSATIDLLAQQITPVHVEAGDDEVLRTRATLVPALARQLVKAAGRTAGQRDWYTSISWLCREHGLRHLVASALLEGMVLPGTLLQEIDADFPTGLGQPPWLLRQLLCARMLADSSALCSLRDDLRGTLDNYAEAPEKSGRLDWETAGPLAAEARAQAALLMKVGQEFCDKEGRGRVFLLPCILARMRPLDEHAVAGQLCFQAGLLPELALQIARVWLALRDAPASAGADRMDKYGLIPRLARRLLQKMASREFKAVLHAPRSRVVYGLLVSQVEQVTQFCRDALARED